MTYFKKYRYAFLNKDAQYMGRVQLYEYFNNLAYHPDPEIAQLYINLTTSPYALSDNWADMHKIKTPTERENLTKIVFNAIHKLKLFHVKKLMRENSSKIKTDHQAGVDVTSLLKMQQQLQGVKMALCKELGIDVIS